MFSFIFWVWHACVEHIGEGEYECASDFGQFAHFQVACIELAIFDTHANDIGNEIFDMSCGDFFE
jgi:hypothetical protein